MVEGVIEKIINSKPFGLLIILPENDKQMSEGVRKLWKDTQAILAGNAFRIPIFFSQENKENLELYKNLLTVSQSNQANKEKRWVPGKYQFVISSTDPVKLDSIEL